MKEKKTLKKLISQRAESIAWDLQFGFFLIKLLDNCHTFCHPSLMTCHDVDRLLPIYILR